MGLPDPEEVGASMISAFESYYSQSFAASPTAPETDNVAYLKSDIKTRDAVLSIQDKRIAELEAELLALRSQEPVAWYAYDDCDSLHLDTMQEKLIDGGWEEKDVRPLYAAAGAQEKKHE